MVTAKTDWHFCKKKRLSKGGIYLRYNHGTSEIGHTGPGTDGEEMQ